MGPPDSSGTGPKRGGVGLYHLAWQLDTIDELVAARHSLLDAGAYTGESSHGATKSVDCADPDGNEFELMWMLPRGAWGPYESAAPIEHLDLAGEVRRWSGVATAGRVVARHRGGDLMTAFDTSTVAWTGNPSDEAPLVVLLHGRGSNESDIIALAEHLPDNASYAAVRAPIAEGGGYAWFANRGIGRPVAESLAETMSWFRTWLDSAVPAGRSVLLVGFSGGGAVAGGLVLDDPDRYLGAAILYRTLPFDAGVPTTPGRLTGVPILVAQGDEGTVIPRELLERTWDYLHGDAGAEVEGIRSPGGHGISPTVANALARWITSLTTEPRP